MSTQTIQAIRVHQYGGPEELKLERIPRPEPQAGEVLVRIHAAGVNPIDWKIRAGRLKDFLEELKLERTPRPEPQAGEVLVRTHFAGVNPIDWKIRAGRLKDFLPVKFPYTPGLDLAGVVEEIGPGVTAFQKGQAVFGQSPKGAYAEYTAAPVEKLAPKPKALSFDEAAAIPIGATTAWQGIFDHGGLQAGQRVLIQGAAGGVGQFAVQFARWKGAHVIGTTSTANIDFVRSLGAETVIDYTSAPVEQVVHDVDLVFDTVGGNTLESSLRVLKRGGTLVTITGQQPPEEKVRERGVRVASLAAQVSSDLLHTFAQLIDEGQVKVFVGERFSLNQAQQAHERSQNGHGRGRIVLSIAD